MVKTIMPYLVKANIIFIAINHINQKINTGFLPTPSQNNYLGQDESISGSKIICRNKNYLIAGMVNDQISSGAA